MISPVRPAGVREEKLVLRQAIAAARDAMDAQARASASRTIAARILALDGFADARVVLAFLPFRSEWDATILVRAALAAGKEVAAPRVDVATRMLRALRLDSLERDVVPGYRGIPEPAASCAEISLARIDVVLVPGVAFDAEGRRLGYGGGYYDRLLPLLSATAKRVAGAFELQIVARAPAAAHDAGVDWVITEERTMRCARR